MKKLLALCLTAFLCLCCFSSCGLSPKIERFIPDEQIMSVEIKTTNYETGIDEITKKHVLTDEQSDEIISLLNEITYAKRYNVLKEKWTHVNDVKYIFTFETQKVALSENHIYIYDNKDTLLKHVEFNSSTFNDYLEQINEVLDLCTDCSINVVDETTKIEVTQYDIGKEVGVVTVTEEASIKHIVDNLNSLKLNELKYNELTAIEYELIFYDADGEMIKTISITLDGWVDYHGSLHSVIGGELDIAYLEGLFTVPDEEPGKNDILYAAAYPEDFEYNGRHYRLVQGDGLKTTATQEELGELLGYIIREADVSAFTQEYSGVDYVIDNSIYDYDTNNRVAFYSIKAYPDLSFICMNQLGEYVLFQEEQSCQTN